LEKVFLKRLQFQAEFSGHVADFQNAKVRQAGLGADGGELRHVNQNFIGGKLIRPSIDFREAVVEP
jgi:hypothetical protein